ncbi:FAD-dependent oxidoreductase [Paractinoplanes ferrugineus]|uniref:D-amino-acid oxidase n=1 Tax=Paractinoplanes ferrugineus TaxID=113564 RepID=A0A919J1Y3_9ACTN|nr:FAD-dependent oxidoreductase [Actinoplanes ferrugineus]GIE11443.1 amino acid oxidase [Actinoplanes ferrugineus]
MPSNPSDVLIVGAGVSGLTTGFRLARQGLRVRIRAEDAPGSTNSAAAGAIWDPIYAEHPRVGVWAARSYKVFSRMTERGFPGVRLVDGIEASRDPMETPEWARLLPGYRECELRELPPGFEHGWHYRAPIIDMPPYLARLEQLVREAGGDFEFGVHLSSLADADAPIVVNCSGAGAHDLVPDPEVTPIRGQLVQIRNHGVTDFFAEHTPELGEMVYLLPQGDTILLGGSAEPGIADPEPDPAVAAAIIERCISIFPWIEQAEVVGHRGGIRPSRPKIRLEHEEADGRHVVHNYGHSGAGVSLSWGCADDVTDLVLGLLGRERKEDGAE